MTLDETVNRKPSGSEDLSRRYNEEASLERIRSGDDSEVPANLSDILDEYGIGVDSLEIGCGSGRILRNLPESALGIDFIRANCMKCSTLGHEVLLADANRSLPFREASFESVICSHTLEHIRDPLGALVEMRRVLKTRGTLLLSLPAYRSLVRLVHDGYFEDHDSHLFAFDAKSISRLLANAGFQVIEFRLDLPRSHKLKSIRWMQGVLNRNPRQFMFISNSFWVVSRRV